MSTLTSLFPLLIALFIGFLVGKQLPDSISSRLISLMAPLVWIMLFFIGFEFGEILFSANAISVVISKAVVFSILATIIPALFVLFVTNALNDPVGSVNSVDSVTSGQSLQLVKSLEERTVSELRKPQRVGNNKREGNNNNKPRWSSALPAIKEACIALAMVFAGAVLFYAFHTYEYSLALPSSSFFLLLLIMLIGIDFTHMTFDNSWLSLRVLMLPFCVVIGSMFAALLSAWMCDEEVMIALGLSSGFGWFSLSSVLMGEALGKEYGTMALMIDLFRELFAIVIIYSVGLRYPHIGIACGGATSADSTLPMIKATSGSKFVPTALVSGVILSLLAPLLMTLFIF